MKARWKMQSGNVPSDPASGIKPAPCLALLAALAVAGLGLALTTLAWTNTKQTIHDKAQADFEQHVTRLTTDIQDRLARPLYGLRGVAGAWKSTPDARGLQDRQFQAYFAAMALGTEFPGVHGFSFVERVPRQQLAQFEAARRAEGEPGFSVAASAHRDDLYVVKYITPLAQNGAALGLDIGSDPVKLGAIENAAASGEATLSGKVTLIQDPSQSPGFLYLLPLFADAPPKGQASSQNPKLLGLFSAPILVRQLLADTHQLVQDEVEFQLFDGTEVSAASQVFAYPAKPGRVDFSGQRVFSDSKTLLVGNTVLTLNTGSSAVLEARMDHTKPLLVGLGGGLLSLLASALVWLLWTGRNRAEIKAGRMTGELERLAHIVRHTNNSVIMTAPDLRITWVNEGFTRLYGYSMAQAVGRTPGDLLGTSRTSPESIRQLMEGAKAGTAVNVEVVNRRADGQDRWILCDVQPMLDARGQITGFIEIATDITAEKRATEAAEEASRSKSQFLANMSHEIRTPMNAILGMLKLTEMTPLSPQQQDYISKSQSAAMSLLRLINDILDFSKIDAGKLELDLHLFRIDRLLRDLAVILSANANNKLIEILFDIDPDLPEVVLGDALRLQQVLINLGGNAIKFTARGQVVIALRKVPSSDPASSSVGIEFSVADSGIGIAPEHHTRIFSGFTQAEGSTTRKYGGTGLGLVISQRLVAAMGGQLDLSSEVGRGTRFFFTLNLPMAKEVPADLARPLRPVPAKYRLLIVDDNPVACELMRGMTRNWSASCDVAHTGEEALALLKNAQHEPQPPYEVIYLDCQMPGIDGWETARQIRQMGLGSTAPQPVIIMVTANGREVLTARTQEEQQMLNGFLVKPITASMLLVVRSLNIVTK